MTLLMLVYVLLLLAALVCFLIATFAAGPGEALGRGRVRFISLGLALWVTVPLLQAMGAFGRASG